MSRVSIKCTGASGQGINSIGEILAKGLMRAGYVSFGYREYPSLIKGGHASYQVDTDNIPVRSSETKVNILLTLNHHGFEHNLHDVKDGGYIIHDVEGWKWSDDDAQYLSDHKITVVYIPLEGILRSLNARPVLANVVLTAFVWDALGQDIVILQDLVREQFAHKGEDVVAKNMQCIDAGVEFEDASAGKVQVKLPKPNKKWQNHLLITGSKAMGLGAVHGGMRFYAGYPMTPSSPLLAYIASIQKEAGLVVKQAEDEITAAQMMSGAMHMGTRALTATSGGGFDLMTETLSMNGMIENPAVFVLAQRPGPATGNPTWTAQGDLLLAVGAAHGEFPRCVMAVSDAQSSFDLMPEAFNIAEEWQTPVIVLTEKHTAEALYTQKVFDQHKAKLRRGKLVTKVAQLKALKSTDRYDPDASDGVSSRWLPGSKAETFNAQADEHSGDGSVDESAINAHRQMQKRMRKMQAMKQALPDPELFGSTKPEVLLVGWGSTKGVVLDALEELEGERFGYLHFSCLWPLRTDRFEQLAEEAQNVVLIEGNYQGQLGMLLKQECGREVDEKILKYDGRPFFVDELISRLTQL